MLRLISTSLLKNLDTRRRLRGQHASMPTLEFYRQPYRLFSSNVSNNDGTIGTPDAVRNPDASFAAPPASKLAMITLSPITILRPTTQKEDHKCIQKFLA